MNVIFDWFVIFLQHHLNDSICQGLGFCTLGNHLLGCFCDSISSTVESREIGGLATTVSFLDLTEFENHLNFH